MPNVPASAAVSVTRAARFSTLCCTGVDDASVAVAANLRPKARSTARPASIPTPAAPKPQCQLASGSSPRAESHVFMAGLWARKPVNSGAKKPPTLMPI